MPSYTRGLKRENLVFVLVNDLMYFGFKPKDIAALPGVSAGDVTALGHVAPNAVPAGKVRVIGANAPKPPRATKRTGGAVGTQQTISTYCGYNNIGQAQTAGWSLTKSRSGVMLRSPNSPRPSQTAIAELSDGSLYCFPMNKADFQSYGAELGLKDSTIITSNTERNKLVSGSSLPRPGRATKLLSSGASFSSFFSSENMDSLMQAGYDIISEEKILVGAPSNP
jgi:hypothetical protein